MKDFIFFLFLLFSTFTVIFYPEVLGVFLVNDLKEYLDNKYKKNIYRDIENFRRTFSNIDTGEVFVEHPSYDFSSPSSAYKFTFILASPRSGSSEMMLLLNSKCPLAMESFPLSYSINDIMYNTVEDEQRDIYQKPFFHKQPFFGNDANKVAIYRNFIYDILTTYISQNGLGTNIIFKDVHLPMAKILNSLDYFFGDNYKIIYLIRDPRDSISSWLEVHKRRHIKISSFYDILEDVYFINKAIKDSEIFKNHSNKMIIIKYEDYVNKNPLIIKKIEEFTNIKLDFSDKSSCLENYKNFKDHAPDRNHKLGKKIDNQSIGSYKNKLNFFQKYIIEKIFFDSEMFHYPK